MTDDLRYILIPSAFGSFGLLWQEGAKGTTVRRVLLPQPGVGTEESLRAAYPGAAVGSCPAVDDLADRLRRFLAGEPITFALEGLALDDCPPFQQRVLRAEHAVPRGWVTSYGRIARHLGRPGAARAVGQGLAGNPFPIFIPCHRAIASGGGLGGYQGGLAMKRALLEMEGVEFTPRGTVANPRFHYF